MPGSEDVLRTVLAHEGRTAVDQWMFCISKILIRFNFSSMIFYCSTDPNAYIFTLLLRAEPEHSPSSVLTKLHPQTDFFIFWNSF